MSDGIPAESKLVLAVLAGAALVASGAAWRFWRRVRSSGGEQTSMTRVEALSEARRPFAGTDARNLVTRAHGSADTDASEAVPFMRFDEAPLDRVEQAFERLVAQGVLSVERTTEEALFLARVPAHVGPVFRTLARRYRSIEFPEVGVRIVLHDGEIADDVLGGWRLRAEPEELDIRLPPPGGWPDAPGGDVIIDATWSPQSGSEVAQHSTMLHFIVRAAVGDRI